jgi:hypothetical protein
VLIIICRGPPAHVLSICFCCCIFLQSSAAHNPKRNLKQDDIGSGRTQADGPFICNLYSLTKGQAAIRDWFRAKHDRTGNLPLFPGIFPDQMAPIVRLGADSERELVMARWGMTAPSMGWRRRLIVASSLGLRNLPDLYPFVLAPGPRRIGAERPRRGRAPCRGPWATLPRSEHARSSQAVMAQGAPMRVVVFQWPKGMCAIRGSPFLQWP